jgi:hypothetical protein
MYQKIALRKSQVELDLQKYRDDLQAQKDALDRTLKAHAASGGLSPDTVKKIEAELGLSE